MAVELWQGILLRREPRYVIEISPALVDGEDVVLSHSTSLESPMDFVIGVVSPPDNESGTFVIQKRPQSTDFGHTSQLFQLDSFLKVPSTDLPGQLVFGNLDMAPFLNELNNFTVD